MFARLGGVPPHPTKFRGCLNLTARRHARRDSRFMEMQLADEMGIASLSVDPPASLPGSSYRLRSICLLLALSGHIYICLSLSHSPLSLFCTAGSVSHITHSTGGSLSDRMVCSWARLSYETMIASPAHANAHTKLLELLVKADAESSR